MYWVYLKLDADVNMCSLLGLPSVHAYVSRPVEFKVLLQCNETNPVKSVNTSLPFFIVKDLRCLTESRCKDTKFKIPSTHTRSSINTWWNFHQHIWNFHQHHVKLVQRWSFQQNLMEFPSLHVYIMGNLIV